MLLYFNLVVEHFFSELYYKKKEKISNTKILTKSTDFDVNIFSLWHLEVDRYIYYRKLRGQRRHSKGTSCNLYFGIFFLIIYLNFGSDVFLFVVFSGTSLFFSAAIEHYFSNHSTKEGKIFCSQNGSQFAVFRCYQKPWLIWTWIDNVNTVWWLLSNNTITRDTVEDNTQEFRFAVDIKK